MPEEVSKNSFQQNVSKVVDFQIRISIIIIRRQYQIIRTNELIQMKGRNRTMKTTTTTNTTGRIFGYARVSTQKQSIERQIRNIMAAYPMIDDKHLYTEAYTGKCIEGRVQFEKLCKIVRKGDTIVFDSVSRMSRNASEGFALYQKFFDDGIDLVFIKEPAINTSTYKDTMKAKLAQVHTGDVDADKLMNTIMDAIHEYTLSLAERQIKLAFEQAQKEVDDLRQRTREGLQTARMKGHVPGPKEGQKLTTKKGQKIREQIKKLSRDFEGTLSDKDIMDLTHVARNTYYKYKAQLTDEAFYVV